LVHDGEKKGCRLYPPICPENRNGRGTKSFKARLGCPAHPSKKRMTVKGSVSPPFSGKKKCVRRSEQKEETKLPVINRGKRGTKSRCCPKRGEKVVWETVFLRDEGNGGASPNGRGEKGMSHIFPDGKRILIIPTLEPIESSHR